MVVVVTYGTRVNFRERDAFNIRLGKGDSKNR